MTRHALKIVGPASGTSSEHDGRYLALYNPHVGEHGTIETCSALFDALIFDNAAAALECWKQINRNKPKRSDGKPNRPLTAFSVELVKLP